MKVFVLMEDSASCEKFACEHGLSLFFKTGRAVSYTHLQEGEAELYEELAEKFKEEYPNIEVEYMWTGTATDGIQNMTTARMAGEQIDLMYPPALSTSRSPPTV